MPLHFINGAFLLISPLLPSSGGVPPATTMQQPIAGQSVVQLDPMGSSAPRAVRDGEILNSSGPGSTAPPPPPAADRPMGDPGEPPLAADDIVVSGRRRSSGDPLERVNVQSYKAVQAVDGAVVAPLARGYRKGVPKPVRKGIHNFLDHVQEPIVFLNYLLQLKPGKAAETLGRFAINTTVGVAGVIDVAKKRPFSLPHRPNSLANTLGYYGVKPGPYLFLPLIGPTTLRDFLGTTIDRLILPTAVGAPFNKSYYAIPTNVLSALDYRVTFDENLTKLHEAADPYAATRRNYLERRKAEIDRLHSPEWRARRLAVPPVQPVLEDALQAGSPAPAPAETLRVSPPSISAPAQLSTSTASAHAEVEGAKRLPSRTTTRRR